MKEVSCKALGVFFQNLAKKQLHPEVLTEGVGYDLSHLRNKHERIEWNAYVHFMANVGRVWSDPELVELAGAFLRSPLFRPLGLIARLLLTPRDFYEWVGTKRKGAGNQLFSCIHTSLRESGPHRIEMELSVPQGYAPCPQFFVMTSGGFRDMPRLLGMGSSSVVMRTTSLGAIYSITYPSGGGLLRKLFRTLAAPLAVRAAAQELKEAHEILQERYEQLESAQKQLDQQATALRTAHAISQVIHGDPDLRPTLDAVARALVEVGGFVAAEIEVATEIEGQRIKVNAASGEPSQGSAAVAVPVSVGAKRVGTIHLWNTSESNPAERTELLEYVTPTVTMAIDDALKFTAVVDYRATLEQKVVERTDELRQARDALSLTVVELQAAQEARNRLFANINHEIRTPLSLIMMATQQVATLTGATLEPKARDALDSINHSARRLLHLVDGLLLLAAGQEGKLRIKPAPRDLAGMLRLQIEAWRLATDRLGLHLAYNGPKRCLFSFDEAAVERVVANLLSNAVKFTPSGGSIDVLLAEHSNEIQLSVRDTGVGIDEDFKQRIFQRFEQGRAPVRRGTGGSGIGLAIVKELVEAHGGRIKVGANRGGGTVFTTTLPREPVVPETEPVPAETNWRVFAGIPEGIDFAPQAANSVRVLDMPGPKEATILLAEDDPGLRRMTGEILQQHFRVLMAPDGLSALRLAREHMPDLLVADVGMPGMDGFELTREFRDLPGNRLAPVILLTAYGNLKDRLEGLGAGAVDYVLKPFDGDELLARIRNHLAQRNLALKLHESESLASLGMLSAGLAHEIRNPANALVNAMQPLRRMLPPQYTDAAGPTGQLLSVIQDCAAQIGRLSRDLLGLGKPGVVAGQPELIGKIVDKSLLMAQPLLGEVTVRKKLDFDGHLHCAAPLVVQAVVNLVENAAHAAGPGGWIEVRTRLDGVRALIEVEDSGAGVPRDLRQRIFDPFFTTKDPGQGTGLGLPTSRTIAIQHGGDLTLVDTSDGAVFRLTLPLAGPPAPAVGAHTTTRSAVS